MRFAWIALLLTAVACSSVPRPQPPPEPPKAAVDPVVSGQLVIFTLVCPAPESREYISTTGAPWRLHSGYTLYNDEGNRIAYVRNHSPSPSSDEPPATVLLPPGGYFIRTDLPADAPLTFWIAVEADMETRVDVNALLGREDSP